MPHLLLALRITATTALAGLAMGCVALPGEPYDDNSYYGEYPRVPDMAGGYPATYSTIPVYEPLPRYVYSSPGGIPMPRSANSAPVPRPVWQRGDGHSGNDWR